MSENKEESNSTSSDIKEEEDISSKTEDVKIDESSKDSEKDSVKNDSAKEDSEDESDEEEIGLLDRPVEVSGCRARKKVERLEISFATAKEKAQPIQDGKGKKLGECPRIEFQIQKTSIKELKPLHRILFNRVGGATEIKRNIRKFSGFTFGKSSSEYERKKAQIEKMTGPILKQICAVLDIERGGLKEEIVKRVLEFLLEPKDSGKTVPVSKKKSSTKAKKNVFVKKSKQIKTKVEKEVSNESDAVNDSESDIKSDDDEKDTKSDDDEQDAKNNEDEDAKSEIDSDAEIKKKKIAKKTLPKTEKLGRKEKSKQEEKRGSAKGSKRRCGDSEDNPGEPASKKKVPSDDDIKKVVKRILAAADLQEITMKKVIKQVADAYPACDLTQKKAFIKSTVKSCIS